MSARQSIVGIVMALGCGMLTGSAQAQVCGDANGSGSITVTDGVVVLRAAAGLPSDCTLERCDVNASGSTTVTDGVLVLRAAADLPVSFNCPGAAPQIEVRSLGTRALTAGVPGPVIQVDAQDASSVTLTATTADVTPSFAFNALQLPSGPVELTLSGQPPALRVGIGAGQLTLTIPNTPTIPYSDGTYRFNVLTNVSTTATFQAIINRRQNLNTGRLNLRVFIVDPSSDVPPNPNDPALRAIGEAINRNFADAGITLGSVTFGNVPQEIEEDTFVVDPALDLNSNGLADQAELLFAGTPRDTTERTLDLFVIGEFLGSPLIGFAGGIPGPVLSPATRSSGVVVAAFNGINGDPRDIEELAQTAAHEAGHYLGLFHTTETPPNTNVTDPITDTPICQASTFQANVFACPDASNLMFPLQLNATQQNDLTPSQGFVLQRNPLIAD